MTNNTDDDNRFLPKEDKSDSYDKSFDREQSDTVEESTADSTFDTPAENAEEDFPSPYEPYSEKSSEETTQDPNFSSSFGFNETQKSHFSEPATAYAPEASMPSYGVPEIPKYGDQFNAPYQQYPQTPIVPDPYYNQPQQNWGQQSNGTAYYNPYNAAPPSNALALVAMIMGIAGFLVGITSIVAIVLGHMSLGQIKRTGESGKGFAIAGLVTGYAVTGFGLVYVLILAFTFIGFVASASSGY